MLMGLFIVARDKCKMKKCYFTSDTLVGMEIWIKPCQICCCMRDNL